MSKLTAISAILTVALLSMGGPARAEAPAWTFVEPESWLVVRLQPKSSSLFSGLSHDHLVRAAHFSGTLRYDPADPSSCALSLELAVKDLVVDQPEARQRFKMKAGPDEGDRKSVTGHMLDDDQLDAGKYPKIRFVSTSCQQKGVEVLVRGDLEIHGKKRSIEAPMKISTDKDRITAKGTFGLLHGDFGFEPYSAAFGTIGNAEALKFDVELVAKAQ